MKKILSLLLMICSVTLLTACASQGDLDAIVAEQAALQVKYDALQADYKVLQEQEAPYSDFIVWIDGEAYYAAIDFVKKRQAAEAFAEKGPIEDYLVTVELTTENFGDYFEWMYFPSLNAFGEEDGFTTVILTSKVYQEGLVFYQSDAKYELEDRYEQELDLNSRSTWRNDSLPDSMKVVSVSGNVTFVKSDYVLEYAINEDDPTGFTHGPDDPFRSANVALANGEQLYRLIRPGYEY